MKNIDFVDENTDNWPIVAICYDFDKTLSPTDMQNYSLIPSLGVNKEDFWKEADVIAKNNNMDKILAGLYLFIEKANEKGIKLTKEAFYNYGKDVKLFNGVETWFKRINKFGEQIGIKIEHYIISAGIKEMIEGSSIAKEFKEIFATSCLYKNGVAYWPAQIINATGKTQYLSRISKGCLDITDEVTFHKAMEQEKLRIPYKNIIYIGDSTTDIPAMRMVKAEGGYSIGVYNPEEKEVPLHISVLKRDRRISYYAPADYSENSFIETLVKELLKKKKLQIFSEEQTRDSNERIEKEINKLFETNQLDLKTLNDLVSKDNIAHIVQKYLTSKYSKRKNK